MKWDNWGRPSYRQLLHVDESVAAIVGRHLVLGLLGLGKRLRRYFRVVHVGAETNSYPADFAAAGRHWGPEIDNGKGRCIDWYHSGITRKLYRYWFSINKFGKWVPFRIPSLGFWKFSAILFVMIQTTFTRALECFLQNYTRDNMQLCWWRCH